MSLIKKCTFLMLAVTLLIMVAVPAKALSGTAAIRSQEASMEASIVSEPENVTVTQGNNAQFYVEAEGSGLTYQWQYSQNAGKSWSNSSPATAGYNTSTLTVAGTAARDGFLYRCKITDSFGNVLYSDAATLTVEKPAFEFVSQPAAETVKLGNRAAFTVEAEGDISTYQWQYQMAENGPWWNCTQYTQGYNTTELNVIAAEKRQGFLYRCRVTDTYGNKYYSDTAELTVDIPASYAVLSQPKDTWVMPGKTTAFHIDTQGEGLTFQWEYHKGVDKCGPEYYWIAMGSTTGCKTDTLTIAGISGSTNRDGWAYRCVVTDPDGYIYTTDHAFLHVAAAQITSQPEDVTAVKGTSAVFAVKTEGEVASYQWQYSKNGGRSWYNSSSATQGYNKDTLTVGATASRNGFLYRCALTDSQGNTILTDAVMLTVTEAAEEFIAAHPQDVMQYAGQYATFRVEVQGEAVSYQWQYSRDGGVTWGNSSAATPGYRTDTLTVEANTDRNHFRYRCAVTDRLGVVHYTEMAKLTVISVRITAHPQEVCTVVGKNAVFHAEAAGEIADYRWQYSRDGGVTWGDSSAATLGYNTDTLTVEATAARNNFRYRCRITGSDGAVYYTEKAALRVKTVMFTVQPSDVTVQSGELAVFTVAVEGEVARYQWQFSTNGGATWYKFGFATNFDTLTVKPTENFNGYLCRCVITDTNGEEFMSDAALLTVTAAAPDPEDEVPDLVIDFDDLFPSP